MQIDANLTYDNEFIISSGDKEFIKIKFENSQIPFEVTDDDMIAIGKAVLNKFTEIVESKNKKNQSSKPNS